MKSMKTLEETKNILAENKKELRRKYKLKEIGIFGSFVRGEQTKGSDVDILVEFTEPISLLKFIELEYYISDLIGAKVDLVMKDALKPRIGKHILEEVVNI